MNIIAALAILYVIIGINCIIMEPGQFYRNHSLDVPGMLISMALWPLLLILDRRGLSISLLSSGREEPCEGHSEEEIAGLSVHVQQAEDTDSCPVTSKKFWPEYHRPDSIAGPSAESASCNRG
ncbi:MAG: hypothetical protein AB1611_13400 [bacterium]